MWMQPPAQVTNRWVLHIAASPHQVDDVLADLYIHKRARPTGDPDYPAYLASRESPDEPPAWMRFTRDELERRGYRSQWCELGCAHRPWPPLTEPPTVNPGAGQGRGRPERPAAARRTTPHMPLQRLTTGVPHHHRTRSPARFT